MAGQADVGEGCRGRSRCGPGRNSALRGSPAPENFCGELLEWSNDMTAKIKFCGTHAARGRGHGGGRPERPIWALFLLEDPGPSPSAQARELVQAAAGVPVVGVFADQSAEEILQICRAGRA